MWSPLCNSCPCLTTKDSLFRPTHTVIEFVAPGLRLEEGVFFAVPVYDLTSMLAVVVCDISTLPFILSCAGHDATKIGC